nr:phosphoribosylformylglycinamidine synthase [Candidatus Omnitrophota bacterium]
ITEKKMVDTILRARDLGLYNAITDCGAGGLSSAVGEMGENTGAEVYLERVPLKYKGLSYTEIWISEAQERMTLAAKPKNVKKLINLFENENVEATVIGKFTKSKKLHLLYNGKTVANLDMQFLHNGIPKIKRKAVWKKKKIKEPAHKDPKDLTKHLIKILSSGNVCSKEWVIRQYDHEVQGGSVLKPLQGILCDGPGDACVTKPLLNSKKGIAISNGINFLYGAIDPYWMAASCIDEAIRQIIAVGGNLGRIAILDNFCWGNTNKPKTLGSLVRAALGCYDVAKGYGVPFISGKDSLNNEFKIGRKTISIPPTLLISAIGILDDVEKCISMDFKKAGNLIYAVGVTHNELGGSHYWKILNFIGNSVPKVDAKHGKTLMNKISKAIKNELVISCHDCSEGGIGVTVAEMAFAGGTGADISLKNIPKDERIRRNDILLFSESNSRLIVEVPKSKRAGFEKITKGLPVGLIGETKNSNMIRVEGLRGNIVVQGTLDEFKEAWQKPFKDW